MDSDASRTRWFVAAAIALVAAIGCGDPFEGGGAGAEGGSNVGLAGGTGGSAAAGAIGGAAGSGALGGTGGSGAMGGAGTGGDPGTGGAGATMVLESATEGPPTSSGALISDEFWPGWRFQVPAGGMEVSSVGYFGTKIGVGTIFVAIVALTSGTDEPDSHQLNTADVIALELQDPGLVDLPGMDIHFPLDTSLAAGWYAVVFGTGSHGATSSGGSLKYGHNHVSGQQSIFTLVQSTGGLSTQTAGLRVFVKGSAP
ncbi:MAG: hypothetical protein JRI23_23465 [Deltaproteobacteria bacterium]|nr:hypothetical protein [Deltaproteobacteria bacterium]